MKESGQNINISIPKQPKEGRDISFETRNINKKTSLSLSFLIAVMISILIINLPTVKGQYLGDGVCFDIDLQIEDYCFGSTSWNFSQTVFQEREIRNTQALTAYQTLLAKWKANEDHSTDHPTSDCLAIARDIY
mmetsp:Transcript_13012/g.11510  ORF Transcript_13012/g.11510 Transcript_13012/m.11510 type:complete len:134 (+) Transcript_13012:34-435(+)